MKALRSSLCLFLALALVLALPGPECVAAARGLGRSSSSGMRLTGRASGLPGAGPSLLSLQLRGLSGEIPAVRFEDPFLSPRQGQGLLPSERLQGEGALPGTIPSLPPPGGFLPDFAPERGFQGPSVLERLFRELPDLSGMGEAAARAANGEDFARRLGAEEIPSAERLPAVGGFSSAQGPLALGHGKDSSSSQSAGETGSQEDPPKVNGRGGALLGTAVLASGVAGASYWDLLAGRLETALVAIPMLVLSFVLHEAAHAWMAYKLGDPKSMREGRASLKPKDLRTHIDPWWTVILPFIALATTGFFVAMAKEVRPDYSRFPKRLRRLYKAAAAFAGPGVNLVLAGGGALAYAGLGALGIGGFLPGLAALWTILNLLMAMFNLLPFYPMDGHHIVNGLADSLRFVLPRSWAAKVDSLLERLEEHHATSGILAWLPLVVFVTAALYFGLYSSALSWAAGLFLGAGTAESLGLLAAAALPAGAALGLMSAQKRLAQGGSGDSQAGAPAEMQEPVELVVVLDGAAQPLARDIHLSTVDLEAYGSALQAMLGQLEKAGLSQESISSYNATPIATYALINAVTLRASGARAQEFAQVLRARGYRVYAGESRQSLAAPPNPGQDPKEIGVEAVQALVERTWGPPDQELGPIWRLAKRLAGAVIPQPRVAVLGPSDSAAIRGVAPWLEGPSHYPLGEEVGLDEALKALRLAAQDGNVVILSPWVLSSDPGSPDALLARKLAEQGHIVVVEGLSSSQGRAPEGSKGGSRLVAGGPAFAGAVALLCILFGVTAKGDRLDAVASALLKTLEEGSGRPDLEAAARALAPLLRPAVPRLTARLVVGLLRLSRWKP